MTQKLLPSAAPTNVFLQTTDHLHVMMKRVRLRFQRQSTEVYIISQLNFESFCSVDYFPRVEADLFAAHT